MKKIKLSFYAPYTFLNYEGEAVDKKDAEKQVTEYFLGNGFTMPSSNEIKVMKFDNEDVNLNIRA